LGDDLAGEAHAVGVVFGIHSATPETVGVHLRAAQFLVGGDLAGRGLQRGGPARNTLAWLRTMMT